MTARGLRRGNWSVQELERLRQLLARRGVETTAMLLRRSPESVQRKALDRLRVPPRRGDWTASDDDKLREAFGALDLRLLSVLLGRPATEVRRRAVELRNRQREGPWQRAEIQLLKDLFGTRRDADLEVCLSRPRAEILRKAVELCLAKDKRFAARESRRAATRALTEADSEAGPGLERARMPRWRPEEVARLRAIYPFHDNLTVARELGRSVTSVANKANQLELGKSAALLTELGRTNVGFRHGRQPQTNRAQAAVTPSPRDGAAAMGGAPAADAAAADG